MSDRQAARRAKRKARRAAQRLRAQAQPGGGSPLDELSTADLEAMLQHMARQQGLASAGKTVFDRAPAIPLDLETAPPPWACFTRLSPDAARLVLAGGDDLAHPFQRAKLAARYRVPRPHGLRWAHEASTPQILAVLAMVGVSFDPTRFRALAHRHRDAWALAEAVTPITDDLDGEAAPVVAGCLVSVLWTRWADDVPCPERLCDAMQLGYAAAHRDDVVATRARWGEAWALAAALRPEGDLHAIEATLRPLEPLSSWLDDAWTARWNDVQDHPDQSHDALAFARWVQSVRPGHDATCNVADALAATGDREAGIALLQAALDDHPDEPGLYARLADLHLMDRFGPAEPADALAVLERARARGVDGAAWSLDARREALRSEP